MFNFRNQFILAFVICLFTSCVATKQGNIKDVFTDSETQTRFMLQSIAPARKGNAELIVPRSVDNGRLTLVKSSDWTSGFFPGTLWYLYEHSGNDFWRAKADSFTRLIEKEKWNARTHDMGFKIYCSFGNGYRLTNDAHYKDVIIQAAKTLITRYNKTVGSLRSWDHNRQKWDFPVIIDNMMNLELLFAATKLTGDSVYYNIAVAHANTTLKNHFRNDMSTYHVVDYDTLTGKAVKKNTHQGYSDASAWARGQAWGLYGYTMCYRETGDKRYLQQAEKIAGFILNHPNLPPDLVPYWDFNDPKIPDAPRDASAAAITASALFELSTFSNNSAFYRDKANAILHNLIAKYRSLAGENFGYILLHSTGHKPANSEIDEPINYADYYFLEALHRSLKK